MSQWHRIELAYRIQAAGNESLEVRVNEVTVLGPFSAEWATTVPLILILRGEQSDQTSLTVFYDDLAINDDQGSTDNSWPSFAVVPTAALRPD